MCLLAKRKIMSLQWVSGCGSFPAQEFIFCPITLCFNTLFSSHKDLVTLGVLILKHIKSTTHMNVHINHLTWKTFKV